MKRITALAAARRLVAILETSEFQDRATRRACVPDTLPLELAKAVTRARPVPKRLTPRQSAFWRVYTASGFNASRAARLTGCRDSCAASHGLQMRRRIMAKLINPFGLEPRTAHPPPVEER